MGGRYGLIAVFLGTFVEGETVLFSAGVLAGHGILPLPAVIAVAWAGAVIGHGFWFLVGRWWGGRALTFLKVPADKVAHVKSLVHRHPISSIVLLQYMYGLRIVGATILGVTRLGVARFMSIEAVNCVVWAAAVAGAGSLIGEAAGRWFHGWARWASIGVTALVLYLVVSRVFRAVERRVESEP